MAKPLREPRAAHQLCAIQKLLKSQLPAPPGHISALRGDINVKRDNKKQSPTQHAQLRDSSRRSEHVPARHSQQTNRGNQNTIRRQENDQPSVSQSHPQSQPGHIIPTPSDMHSPRESRHCSAVGGQSSVQKGFGEKPVLETTRFAPKKSSDISQSSSGKRKRESEDFEDNSGSEQIRKKTRSTRSEVQPLETLRSQAFNVTITIDAARSIATATPVSKSRHHPALEPSVQTPAPPSSNATTEHEGRTADMQRLSQTPTESTLLTLMGGACEQNKKRQRDGTDQEGELPKRLRQVVVTRASTRKRPLSRPLFTAQSRLPGSSSQPTVREVAHRAVTPKIQQQASSVRRAQAQAVRPELSFAPVALNLECELKFRDYLHDSVPVLYSSMIRHATDTRLSNRPSGMLVLDALTAIEACSKSQSKRVWPTAIELLGRKPVKDQPVKILNDVDLYIHESEKENKLHVATDRGLLSVTEYLKLIGVPETQPVRFEGRIPPWAKAALQAAEYRKVVQPWGRDFAVKADVALEYHQSARGLEVSGRLQEEKASSKTSSLISQLVSDTSTKVSQATGLGEESTSQKHTVAKPVVDQDPGEMNVLEAETGDLPLSAGSTVIVYKIDDDDVWAYGRLSGTSKTGRFPICHTCPVDWSLDRFARTDSSLCRPLVASADPGEAEWNGLVSWMRQQGQSEGPTWAETLAAAAAKAKDERDRNLAARKATTTAISSPPADPKTSEVRSGMFPFSKALEQGIHTATEPEAVASESLKAVAEEAEVQTFSGRDTAIAPSENVVQDTKGDAVAKPHANGLGTDTPDSQSTQSMIPETSLAAQLDIDVEAKPKLEQGVQGAASSDIVRVSEVLKQSEEANVANANGEGAVVLRNPFTVPRYNPFARNDDIEYDWGDSDEEL